jgi:hypothetical protein
MKDTRESLDKILKEPRKGYYKEDIAKGGKFYHKSDKYNPKSKTKALSKFKK